MPATATKTPNNTGCSIVSISGNAATGTYPLTFTREVGPSGVTYYWRFNNDVASAIFAVWPTIDIVLASAAGTLQIRPDGQAPMTSGMDIVTVEQVIPPPATVAPPPVNPHYRYVEKAFWPYEPEAPNQIPDQPVRVRPVLTRVPFTSPR